jgi:hypothetical protein
MIQAGHSDLPNGNTVQRIAWHQSNIGVADKNPPAM